MAFFGFGRHGWHAERELHHAEVLAAITERAVIRTEIAAERAAAHSHPYVAATPTSPQPTAGAQGPAAPAQAEQSSPQAGEQPHDGQHAGGHHGQHGGGHHAQHDPLVKKEQHELNEKLEKYYKEHQTKAEDRVLIAEDGISGNQTQMAKDMLEGKKTLQELKKYTDEHPELKKDTPELRAEASSHATPSQSTQTSTLSPEQLKALAAQAVAALKPAQEHITGPMSHHDSSLVPTQFVQNVPGKQQDTGMAMA